MRSCEIIINFNVAYMKSPVSREEQAVVPLDKIKRRVACLQKKIKKIEDPEGYVQEVIAEKRDKFLNTALARFERRQAQKSEVKEETKDARIVHSKKKKSEEKSVMVVEDYGGRKTEQSAFDAEAPLKQMVTEETEEPVRTSPSQISHNSKTISKYNAAPPTALVRRPGVGPQAPIPSLLSGSRLLK